MRDIWWEGIRYKETDYLQVDACALLGPSTSPRQLSKGNGVLRLAKALQNSFLMGESRTYQVTRIKICLALLALAVRELRTSQRSKVEC